MVDQDRAHQGVAARRRSYKGTDAVATQPLDAATILGAMRPDLRDRISLVEVVEETRSTNDDLMRLPTEELHGRLLLAERQSAGKGRRGRRWQSPPGNICLSFSWRFDCPDAALGALGPLVGVCVCRTLARFGLDGHGVKWPNDVLADGAKLGGILVETRRSRAGCDAVIGIGLNVSLPAGAAPAIGQPVTDLVSQPGFESPGRIALIAALVEELLGTIAVSRHNLAEFIATSWPPWDLLEGREVCVYQGDEVFAGHAAGITPAGSLRLRVTAINDVPAAERTMEFHSGEVSVRRA